MPQERGRAPDVEIVALTFADGSLGVMQFVTREYAPDGTVRWERRATGTAIAEEIARTAFPARLLPVQAFRKVRPADIPTDRAFRDAWRDRGASIEVDMGEARKIRREQVRRQRDPMLRQLDGEYLHALERGDLVEQQRIAARKQALRDAPADPAIDAAATPDELARVIPVALREA